MPQRLGAMTIILFIVAASLLQTLLEVNNEYEKTDFDHDVDARCFPDAGI